ncbi:uncharacterized protein IUM83_16035 [Phytophthora cinnamomi]|uniref:uncharacterized protein n=1 Tax=Phytophthora cinnamomi TaxID=4785 RepID=UPI003559F87D|nr:hypothetical protein IUM83_16035 [Phytophthora cinnamomi]
MEPGNEPSTEPTQVATGCSDDYEDDNQTDHNFSDADGDDVKNCGQSIDVQLFGRLVEDPEVFALPAYPWTWDDVLPRKEGHRDDGVSLASSASSSPGTNSARSEVFERQVEVDTGSRHCSQSSSADPMRTLEVVKTAVTTTMARIHSAYQDASAPDEQQLEIPSSAAATSAAVSAIRVDEAKRLEFLRALDDFKRCLRPTSSSSSLVSGA